MWLAVCRHRYCIGVCARYLCIMSLLRLLSVLPMLLLLAHQAVSRWGLCLRLVCCGHQVPCPCCCVTPQQTLLHVRKCLARTKAVEKEYKLCTSSVLGVCVLLHVWSCVCPSNRPCVSRLPFVACRCRGVVGGVNLCLNGKGRFPSVWVVCVCVRSAGAAPLLHCLCCMRG